MTVSTAALKEFNVGQIITLAWRHTGLVNLYQQVSTEQMAWGADLLSIIIHELDTEGLFAKAVTFETLTLTTGVYKYSFSTNCIDVVGDAHYIEPGQVLTAAQGELSVRQVDREEWDAISSKDSTGAPSLYWANRVGAVIEAWFWPIPSATESLGSVRVPVQRLRAGVTDTAATPDFESWWSAAFTWELSHHLAVGSSMSTERCNYFATMARQKIERARGKSNQRADVQIRLSHPTSFRGF